jgi:hypothetical protein
MAVTAATAVCAYCLRAWKTRADGTLVAHFISLPVGRDGSVTRRCSGSGRPPKAERKATAR